MTATVEKITYTATAEQIQRMHDAFDQALRLLHPIIPFITEALWQRLARQGREQVVVEHCSEAARTRFLESLRTVLDRRPSVRQCHNLDSRAKSWAELRMEACLSNGGSPDSDPRVSARRSGAYIVATPNPVSGGPELGMVTIVWSTGSGERGQVRMAHADGAEIPFAEGLDGAQNANWIRTGKSYEFRLYAGRFYDELLASVTVVRPETV
jgi:hypothetical protein